MNIAVAAVIGVFPTLLTHICRMKHINSVSFAEIAVFCLTCLQNLDSSLANDIGGTC